MADPIIASVLQFEADLAKTIQKTILRDLFVTEDKNAHTFRVKITRAGEPVDLTGATVTGYFMRYKDRVSIPLTGSVEGSEAVLTLNDGCYAMRTMFCVTICVAVGAAKHAVFAGEGQMVLNRSDAVVDTEGVIPSIEDIISQYDMMKHGTDAANAAASSANTAAGKANTAASTANIATTNANNATARANTAAAVLENAPVPTGTVVTYQAGTSPTTPPTGAWLANPPAVSQGQYLWTRTVQSFTNGNPVTSYSVARQGMDGSGSVAAVDGVSPNSSGNVVLGAVRSVNGSKPDSNGNVEVDAGGGTVQSVNSVQPDAGGNITLTGANVPVSSTDTRKVNAAIAQHDNTVKTLTAEEFEALTTEEKAALFDSGVRVIAVEGDLDPDDNRYGYIINQDGTTAPLSDPHALHRGESVARADVAANAEMLGGMLPSEFAKAGETGVQMELLWENASPTDHFSAQTINVAGLSECDAVFYVCRHGESTDSPWGTVLITKEYDGQKTATSFATYDAAVYVSFRRITVNFSNNKVIFENGSQNGTTSNGRLIPLALYGIKGVS